MTRFLTSFLRIGAAMVILVGLSAGTAMGQTFFDPSQSGTGGTGAQATPYLAGEFDAALTDAGAGGTIVVLNSGALNNQTGVSQYDVPATAGGDITLQGDGEDVTMTLDLDLNLGPNQLILDGVSSGDGVNVEFPGNDISLLADATGALPNVDATSSSDTANRIVFTGEGTIRDLVAGGNQIFHIERLSVDGPVTFDDNNNAGQNPDRLRVADFLSVSGDLDLGGNRLDYQNNAGGFANVGVSGRDVSVSGTVRNGQRFNISLSFGGSGDYTIEGTGDIEVPLTYEAKTGNNSLDQATFQQTSIGQFGFSNFGTGGAAVNEVDFPNLTDVRASLQIEGSDADVDFGAGVTVESTVRILSGATAETSAFTANGDVEIQGGDTEVTFGNTATFAGDVSVSGDGSSASASATFNGTTTFQQSFDASSGADLTFGFITAFNGATTLSGSNTVAEFAAPGTSVDEDSPQSTVAGDFVTSGGVTIQQRDDTGAGNGLHNIALNGNIAFDDPTLTQDGSTRIFVNGSNDQALAVVNASGTFEVDRLVVQNDLERTDWGGNTNQSNGDFIIDELLRLEDGDFVTNGGVAFDTDNEATLVRVSSGGAIGRLLSGTSDVAFSSDGSGNVNEPHRLEYQGGENIVTSDELLPPNQPDSDLTVNEFAVNMTEDPTADVVLGIDFEYTVTGSLEILNGNLAFSDESSLALANNLTFVRGDGGLITEEITSPEDALTFPDVSTVGADGINLEYVNDAGPITTGLEFPTTSENAELVLDLTVDNGEPVLLAEASTYQVNRNVEVTSGSALDFNGQTLRFNTVEGDNNDFEVVNDGTIASADGSLLEFAGRGEANVVGDVQDSSSDFESPKVFTFPAVTVSKPDDDGDADDEARRVLFEMDDASGSEADGFEFSGDFLISAAQNWESGTSPGTSDGVEFESDGADNEVDVVRVNGDFTQNGGSVLAFDDHEGSEFTVTGNFTKNAAASSRFYAGGASGSVDAFTVGTEENTLSQANGTFYAIVNNSFTVNGDVINNSPDKWTGSFTSEAFEVDGDPNATADISGSVTQDTTGTPRGDVPDTESRENAGTFRVEGFTGDNGEVLVGDSFNNVQGITEIVEATLVDVANDVVVESDSMSVNLGRVTGESGQDDQEQRFLASTLSVASADGSSSPTANSFHDPDAVFEASTESSVATPDLSSEPSNPEPSAEDQIRISGDTDVGSSGQLYLEGFELQQGGNFTLEGFGDRPWSEGEGLSYTADESGLLGLVRFVNDGDAPQTITTDESPSTYFHGLAIDAPGDVELASDVATNEASGGQGLVGDSNTGTPGDGTASGTLRPFGTLFLESGNLITGDNRITILAPEPTDGGDLVEAVSADESRAGSPTQASPVIGGSNTTKVVGTMRRALAEQNEDTGGQVSDGYIYPLGTETEEPRYRALVLELPTDETQPQFFTVETVDDPNVTLPDGLASVDAFDAGGEIALDVQSLPYFEVTSEEDANFNSFNIRSIAQLGPQGINEVRQIRLIQNSFDAGTYGDWQEAGLYDRDQGSNIDDDNTASEGGPNASISGFINVIHEGVDLRDGQVIGLASQESINPFGQTDAPFFPTDSQPADQSLNVGESTEVTFTATDTDTEGANLTFSAEGDVGIGSPSQNGNQFTVPITPDSADAEDSFVEGGADDALDLTVEVTDDDGNSGSTSIGVTVGLQNGDANSSGMANPQDASVALDAFLENVSLTAVQTNAADQNDDGSVTPFDAAQILQLALGNTSNAIASAKTGGGSAGTIVIGDADRSDGAISLPVELTGDAENVRSVTVEITLDGTSQKVENVATDLPSGWIADHKSFSDGTLKIGMAGTSALSEGKIATIRLQGTDLADETAGTFRLNGSDAQEVDMQVSPKSFALKGNNPNPFSTTTAISYDLKEATNVSIEVYDILGRKVGTLVNKKQSAGSHEVTLNRGSGIGARLSSGVYIYRIQAGDFTASQKMTVVK